MSNPFTGTQVGTKAQEFAGGSHDTGLIQYDLGGEFQDSAFPGFFWMEIKEGMDFELDGAWERTTKKVGKEKKVIDVFKAPFLPRNVLLAARRAKSYKVKAEKRSFRFPWTMKKTLCVHPEHKYELWNASGVDMIPEVHLLVLLVDHMHLEPFTFTLSKAWSRIKMFDNNLDNAEWGNQQMAWGISQKLSQTVELANELAQEKTRAGEKGWDRVIFTEYGQWIGVGVPMRNPDGTPKILQFGQGADTSPVNPFEYIVLPPSETSEDIVKYNVMAEANVESGLHARVFELQDTVTKWVQAWEAEALIGEREAALLQAAGGFESSEEEDDIPF